MNNFKKVAVVGGAGYIGSFTSHALRNKGYSVVVIDNLSSGHKEAVSDFPFVKLDIIRDEKGLDRIFRKEKFDAVFHFAALLQVGESMRKPGLYFRHNVAGSLNVAECAVKNGVKAFIFSSTSAVYGHPEKIPTRENNVLEPTSPYGESKVMVEKILNWYWKIFNFPSVSIRYFNAAGAALDGSMGADHPFRTQLITTVMDSILKKKPMAVFGGDYDTPDGTCIRDYIHVIDLADAHIKALEYLGSNPGGHIFNAGTGRGYSNLEIIRMAERISGRKVNYTIGDRRPGDVVATTADPTKAHRLLGWKAKYSDLKTILESAWRWHSGHPKGY